MLKLSRRSILSIRKAEAKKPPLNSKPKKIYHIQADRLGVPKILYSILLPTVPNYPQTSGYFQHKSKIELLYWRHSVFCWQRNKYNSVPVANTYALTQKTATIPHVQKASSIQPAKDNSNTKVSILFPFISRLLSRNTSLQESSGQSANKYGTILYSYNFTIPGARNIQDHRRINTSFRNIPITTCE